MATKRGEEERVLPDSGASVDLPGTGSWFRLVMARLLIGWVVLICAEVFSGASLGLGLWHPWTLLVTYWLYFAHFFFCTTMAVRTGRASLSSLYLWGVLFGLYESWITKVVWYGYGGDGSFVIGSIGPFGFSEISMVFFFHPLVSFIIPLAVTCLLCPTLRGQFPDLAWLTGRSKFARLVQVYLLLSFAPVMGMNSGGPVNLAINAAVAVVVLLLLKRLARPALATADGRGIVAFGRWGFTGLCVYVAILYCITYGGLRPEGLPSVPVQLITFVFYALAIAGLWLHRRREPSIGEASIVERHELKLAVIWFIVLLGLALVFSIFAGHPGVYIPIVLNFIVWTIAGFLLTLIALAAGVREFCARADGRG